MATEATSPASGGRSPAVRDGARHGVAGRGARAAGQPGAAAGQRGPPAARQHRQAAPGPQEGHRTGTSRTRAAKCQVNIQYCLYDLFTRIG